MEPADHVSEGMPVHRWKPIEDLPQDRSALDRVVAEVAALRRAWAGRKAELEASGALTEFNARLSRQWCIETGILEGIYTLDRGATTTLIEHGFDAALLSHGDTDVGEQTLIRILRDHQDAIEGLFAFVKEDRPLSTSYVKALHQVLVAHQSDIEVIDGQGRLSRLPLRKGDWKLIPNNPGDPRTLELVHEYSPPEEVAAEMDRLVAMHRAHDGVEAEISAAWLHHRFVQIHPFQDGNGRAARSLATLVLIQRGGFPFVVLRDDKNAYIDALRAADDGNLVPFVEFVCRLQKKALLQAIEHGAAALTGGAAIPSILEAVRDRLKAERLDENSVLLGAAELLRAKARERMQSLAEQVTEALPRSPLTGAWSYDGNPMHVPINGLPQATKRAADAASQADDWMNALLVISHGRHAVIRVSFDRFGDQSGAIMAASASVILFDRGGQCVGPAEPCAREPFTFTAGRDLSEVETAFDAWLEQSLTLGLEIWRRSL